MSWMRALRLIALGLAVAYAFPAACGSGGVVGGKCRQGYAACENGSAQGGEGQLNNSKGGALNVGGTSPTAAAAGNGTAANGQGGDGELPDGGIFDSPVNGEGDAEAPLECLPPHKYASHCGDCDTQCGGDTPLCEQQSDDSYACVAVDMCLPPKVECHGQCVLTDSFKSDPDNCGKCGHHCPSDICSDGICRGARYGNIALLCSDFNSATTDSQPTVLLGNAIFLPAANPVRVLAYTRGATSAAVRRVNTVIDWAGAARGRSAQISEARSVADVTGTLNIDDFEVLLIHDLDQAKSGEPEAAAASWDSDSVLSSFAKAGGVIVVLDGGDGTGEMHNLINAGKLLDPMGAAQVSGETEMPTGGQVWNNAPFDVLGGNVLSPFAGTSHTCTFDTDATPGQDLIFVLTDDETRGQGDPVAIHRVIAP